MTGDPALLQLFDHHQRYAIEYPGMRKDVLPNLVRFVRPLPGMSFIRFSDLDDSSADAAIREQVAYFTHINQPFAWKLYAHDAPADLRERLLAHGFEYDDDSAVMLLDLHEAPSILLQPVQVDVRPLTRRAQIEDVIAVETGVWGGDYSWMRQRLGDHLDIPGYLSLYAAYVDGAPACAGWTYFHPGSPFTDLWGGSSLPEYRRRGLYSALLACRVQEALRRGVRYLTVDAGSMSRPILEKHGFGLLDYAYEYQWQPAKEAA